MRVLASCLIVLGAAVLAFACERANLTLGDNCNEKTDCASGLCLMETVRDQATGWVGGYCSDYCQSDDDCGEGSSCQELDDGSYCLDSCDSSDDCRESYICNSHWSVCLPNCQNDGWTCGEDYYCTDVGECILGSSADDGADIGEACDVLDDCMELMFCIKDTTILGEVSGWVDGYCSKMCPGLICPENSQCYYLVDGPVCLKNCAGNADCREGYVCDTDWMVCLPDCREGWSCRTQQACDNSDGICKLPGRIDGDVDGDMPTDGDTPQPALCDSDADCVGVEACPPEATKGCVCVPGGPLVDDQLACIPACERDTDCISLPNVIYVCAMDGTCQPEE